MVLFIPSKTLTAETLEKLAIFGTPAESDRGWRSVSTMSYMSNSSSASTISIPDDFESVETIVFLGFTEVTATAIFERFRKWREEGNIHQGELLDFITGHLISITTDAYERDDEAWDKAMLAMGVDIDLRARILTPGFEDIRFSESAKHWVVDTIKARHAFLKTLNRYINDDFVWDNPSGYSQPPGQQAEAGLAIDRTKTPGGPPSEAKRPQMQWMAPPTPLPQVKSKVVDQKVKNDETLLFKGGDLARLETAIGERGLILENLASELPTDFSRRAGCLYFTKQLGVARRYAEFASRRMNGDVVPVAILNVITPNEKLADALEVTGNHWADYVWANRLQLYPVAGHLARYTRASILIGPTLNVSTDQVVEWRREGRTSTTLDPWKVDGQSATQYCIQDAVRIEEMGAVSRLWVDAITVRRDAGEGSSRG
ncbi:MAG: hypothetical protein M1836_005067 [Candelina mexicana]|nr:MAG: hypothetical protein M1836_005067 [Candelina mexicana]